MNLELEQKIRKCIRDFHFNSTPLTRAEVLRALKNVATYYRNKV